MRLAGKVAFISGGARGMGATEAKLFANEGAAVAIGDVLEEAGKRTEAEINQSGGQALFVSLDVTSEQSWLDAIGATVAKFGRLDILVNNAGVSAHGMIEFTTEADWDRVMDVNSKGPFLGTKAAIPEMRKSGGGSIINISSQLGLVGTEMSSPQYQSSKGAIRLLTKTTALQYAPDGIRCNSVHPGPVNTDMTADSRGNPENLGKMVGRIPMGRYGEPVEIANGVLYLASDESGFVTGSELVLDGGWTAQ
ncbi:MAG TPA: glucose 1-dehydrogenase [Dehalococcoidia bacterium]|jgi:cyclopentanol dehydrogenase|nr:glucose 1-dehydrogenase [SAR202 cluster bacterium]PCH91290.1 MAG: cyclopentanol dehydrogenase [Dehalococcoidia bacterium]RUA05499.1 MAG: cyclopentanol dehydrogenase [Candidatus Poseidoniales archaeon]MQG84185.1 glucose 1-dehydrogenase [SAR202 cluster bacterium]HBD84299.1 cyclopentanol dehydrogenase [Dehalococcoidia bacterium]|tara:strand:- start:3871 stop:4623 length:753 start_codon:yes stop_codon:yes gene_type:complete